MEHAVDKIVKIFKKKAPKDGDAAHDGSGSDKSTHR